MRGGVARPTGEFARSLMWEQGMWRMGGQSLEFQVAEKQAQPHSPRVQACRNRAFACRRTVNMRQNACWACQNWRCDLPPVSGKTADQEGVAGETGFVSPENGWWREFGVVAHGGRRRALRGGSMVMTGVFSVRRTPLRSISSDTRTTSRYQGKIPM